MFMRQVLPSSPGVSRGVRSREPRREPRPGQSTWSRETLRALFPFAWRHVKWVFAYSDDQDPPGGERSTQPPLNSTPRHTYSGLTVGTFMIRHGLLYACINNQSDSCSSLSYATVLKRRSGAGWRWGTSTVLYTWIITSLAVTVISN